MTLFTHHMELSTLFTFNFACIPGGYCNPFHPKSFQLIKTNCVPFELMSVSSLEYIPSTMICFNILFFIWGKLNFNAALWIDIIKRKCDVFEDAYQFRNFTKPNLFDHCNHSAVQTGIVAKFHTTISHKMHHCCNSTLVISRKKTPSKLVK